MFDLNTILSAAITQAIEAATATLTQRITALEEQLAQQSERTTATGEIDLTSVDFVQAVEAITTRIVADAVSESMYDHCNEYDHDEFLTEIDDSAVEDAVHDAVRNLSFEVTVSR